MPSVVFRRQQGSAALYTVIAIPIVFSFAILAVDISRLQASRDLAQKEADRIVQETAKVLPNTVLAYQLASSAVNSLEGFHLAQTARCGDRSCFDPCGKGAEEQVGKPALFVSPSCLSLALESEQSSVFDFFLRLAGREAHKFKLQEKSEVQITPSDNIIILSDAVTLRPLPGLIWGDVSLWPEAGYLRTVEPPIVSPGTKVVESTSQTNWPFWWQRWSEDKLRHWITQSCYNPLFSGLKYAAISLIDLLGAQENNRLSLIFTPGQANGPGYSVVRDLDFIRRGVRQANWLGYVESEGGVPNISDEACVYLADSETSTDLRYNLMSPPSFLIAMEGQGVESECFSRFSFPLSGLYYPVGNLSPCFTDEKLQLREAVYFHAARRIGHSLDGSDISSAISQGVIQLLNGSGSDQLAEIENRRGNMAAHTVRRIIVLGEIMPDPLEASFQKVLQQLEKHQINLYLVGFIPEMLKNDPQLAPLVVQLAQRKEQFLSLKKKNIRFFIASDQTELSELIIPQISALGREAALRR